MNPSRLLRSMLCGVLAGLSACGPSSQLTANDNVLISGTAQQSDGTDLAAEQTLLIRHPDLLQTLVQFTATVATLGLACLSNADSICQPLRTATTANDGTFVFPSVKGSETQGSVKQALLFSTFVPGPVPTGTQVHAAAVTTDFYVQRVTVALPTARLWQPAITETLSSGSLAFAWPSLQQGVGQAAELYTVQVTDTAGNAVWTRTSTTPSLQLDPRVTEDFGGSWNVTADRTAGGADTSFAFHYLSPSQPFTSTGQRPPSRGATCTVSSLSGQQALNPCPLTDGDLGTFFSPITCPKGSTCAPGKQNNSITLDLGATQSLQGYLFHQLTVPAGVSLLVDYSVDGSAWLPMSTPTSDSYQLVKLPTTLSARYVRLRLNDATAEFSGGINEVAFF